MFSRFLSINPPEPELLFDVKREHKANSDYPDGYPSLHDFSHNGCFATYQNGILNAPELYYNPWILTAPNRCETVELKTGVWHVTKLTPPTTNGFNSILFSCPSSTFIGLGSKFGVYISKPEGKEFGSSLFYNMNETNEEMLFSQYLFEGMNVVDLSRVPEMSGGFYWRLKVPESFYNQDENGGLLETETDFYVIFFPVLDESQCNGYGEYLLPKFNKSFWNIELGSMISNNGLTLNNNGANTNSAKIVPYYDNGKICVISPMFFNFRIDDLEDEASSYLLFSCVDSDGTPILEDETVNIHTTTLENNGSNISFYGYCLNHEEILPEDLESVIAAGVHHNVGFYPPKKIITMLPYNNDRLTVAYSGNNTNVATIQVNETVPFHDKCELQTLITKYRNTYKGSSILYRNEVASTSEDLLGIYGFRLNTYGEDRTQNSHRHCIIDHAQGRWENLVSYCNNTIVTNQITDYELLYKDTVSAVVLLNKEITSEDCTDTGCRLFSCHDGINCFSGQFYYLIAFKERLTPWQIAWALSHLV